jgi:hypothetical protein
MKVNKLMMPLALAAFMLLANLAQAKVFYVKGLVSPTVLRGYTLYNDLPQARQSPDDVEVTISLPYRGIYNNWTIAFRWAGDRGYTADTGDETYQDGPTHVLGYIPQGQYDIYFYDNGYYYYKMFDFGVNGNFQQGYPYMQFNEVLNNSVHLQIDEW